MKAQLHKGMSMSGQELRADEQQVKESPIHGYGVFANRRYEAGSDIAYFEGYEIDHDTRHSLTFDGHKIEPTGVLRYLNHSCEPNCYFKGRVLVAREAINPGDELTINYCDTEETISFSFNCNCRRASCDRRIGKPA